MATNRNPNTWSTWFSDNAGQPHQPNDVHAPSMPAYDASNDYTDRPQSFFPTRQQTNDTSYFDHTSSIPLSATPVSQQNTAYASTPSTHHYDTPTSPPLSSASPAPSSKPYPVSTGMTPALSSASPPVSASPLASSATPYGGYDHAGSNAQLLDNSPTPRRSFTPTQDYGMPNNVAPDDEAYARALYHDEANKIYGNQGPASPRDSSLAGNISPGAQGRLSRSNTPADPDGKTPIDPKVLAELDNRRKWRPWFCWSTALAMTAVLIYELIQNKAVTGNIIELNPPNIMIGPSANVLIGVGARFVPCMRLTQSFPVAGPYQCPNMTDVATTNTTNQVLCTLTDLCLLGGFKDPSTPDQWFRFITPIFLHGGVVHLLMNMLVQLRLGASLEKEMGPFRFALIYLSAGIAGFIFGGNFAPIRNPSMGCSGALFGLIGCLLVDLIQNWRLILKPWWELAKLVILTLISFAFGLLPWLDNFAHIGGFFTGIFAGILLIPAVHFTKAHRLGVWIARVISLPILVCIFYFGITNFYSGNDPAAVCPWCKYLACLPIAGLCDSFNNNV